jgi:hypothetical protein
MTNPLSISIDPIWEIVERSAFLEERLGTDFLPETRADDFAEIETRVAAWQKNCARGDEKVFAKRLAWDGLDADRAQALVGRVRRTNGLPFGESSPSPLKSFFIPSCGSPEKHCGRSPAPPIPY